MVAVILAGVDTFYRHVSWEAVTLLCIGALPLLVTYVSALELPGGLKISTRDVRRIGDEAAEIVQDQPVSQDTEDVLKILSDNPDIALAGLRVEFERKLLEIARLYGKQVSERSVSITLLTRRLRDMNVLRSPEVDVLLDLIPILNDAVHARQIDREVRNLVLNSAKPLLAYLDVRIRELSPIAALRGEG